VKPHLHVVIIAICGVLAFFATLSLSKHIRQFIGVKPSIPKTQNGQLVTTYKDKLYILVPAEIKRLKKED